MVRNVKDQVDAIKSALGRMVATRSLRDPLHHLHPELTPPQTHVLAALSLGDPDGMPTSMLGQRICASGPSMTGLIDRLEKQGLVTRERTNDDRRLVKVKLTDAGRVAVSVLDSHITERLTSVLLVLAADDRETFARLFIQILDAVPGKAEGPRPQPEWP